MFFENRIISGSSGGGTGGAIPEGPLNFKGAWDANTNNPTLSSGVGSKGDIYIVSVDGNTNLDGITDWKIKDWVVFDGTAWFKIDNTEPMPVPAAYGEMFFQGSSTETVITTISTPVIIDGTYNSGELLEFTRAGGRLTYTGTLTRLFDVRASTTASLDQVNANISVLIAKSGAVIATSAQSPDCDDTSPSFKSISLNKLVSLATGEYIEVFTQNNGGDSALGTENITHQDISVIVGTPGFIGAAATPTTYFAQTNVVTVESSDTEDPLSGTGTGSMTLAADSLKKGDSFSLCVGGNIRTALSGGGDFLNLKLKSSTVDFLETGSKRVRLIGGLIGYKFNATSTVYSIGATGIAEIHTIIEFQQFNEVNDKFIMFTNNVNFDTTIPLTLELTAQWSINNANNIINSKLLTFNKLGV